VSCIISAVTKRAKVEPELPHHEDSLSYCASTNSCSEPDFERDVLARIDEGTRRIFIPGIAAILTVWLVQSALGLFSWPGMRATSGDASWIFRVYLLLFVHWNLIVSFAVAGAISALYGRFVDSSPKQRYIAALFPVFFEILKWLWLLRFPLAPWIDPAHPPYRFATLPVAASIGYWVIHIINPAVALLGALAFFNRRFGASTDKGLKSQLVG
jgi:hypothetical protein